MQNVVYHFVANFLPFIMILPVRGATAAALYEALQPLQVTSASCQVCT